jgi:hypothetical protein
VVLVLEHKSHRAADRETATHSTHDAREIRLDLLPSTSPVPTLPAREIAPQIVLGNLESGWQALDHNRELRTVRLPGCQPSQH